MTTTTQPQPDSSATSGECRTCDCTDEQIARCTTTPASPAATTYNEGAHAIDLLTHLRSKARAKGYAAVEAAIDAAPAATTASAIGESLKKGDEIEHPIYGRGKIVEDPQPVDTHQWSGTAAWCIFYNPQTAIAANWPYMVPLRVVRRAPAPSREAAPMDERALFEAWANNSAIRTDLGAWEAWQASAALAQPAAPVVDAEPFGYLIGIDGMTQQFVKAHELAPEHGMRAKSVIELFTAPQPPVVDGELPPLPDELIKELTDAREVAWAMIPTMGARQVGNIIDKALKHFAAARSAPVGVPEGWKLVPVEPTEKMVAAYSTGEVGGQEDQTVIACYEAMLAAAPSHPEPAGGKEHEPKQEEKKEV